jgi:hypothetical protein
MRIINLAIILLSLSVLTTSFTILPFYRSFDQGHIKSYVVTKEGITIELRNIFFGPSPAIFLKFLADKSDPEGCYQFEVITGEGIEYFEVVLHSNTYHHGLQVIRDRFTKNQESFLLLAVLFELRGQVDLHFSGFTSGSTLGVGFSTFNQSFFFDLRQLSYTIGSLKYNFNYLTDKLEAIDFHGHCAILLANFESSNAELTLLQDAKKLLQNSTETVECQMRITYAGGQSLLIPREFYIKQRVFALWLIKEKYVKKAVQQFPYTNLRNYP